GINLEDHLPAGRPSGKAVAGSAGSKAEQIGNPKSQIPTSKSQNPTLRGPWDLGFGIWGLGVNVSAMRRLLTASMALVLVVSCSREQPAESTAAPPAAAPAPPAGGRLFVTNEQGGDISVVDVDAAKVIATIAVGKRPRGIRLSPDGSLLFIALSGSPMAPPGVDESKLPPPDKKADGIGVVSVSDQKLLRVIAAGSDPEQTAISRDGARLFVANEDT